MTRQDGYKQVSLTPEAHYALKRMTYEMSASLARGVTLSQAVLIAREIYRRSDQDDESTRKCAQEIGIDIS